MILSYRDKRTARFASGELVREFSAFAGQAFKRLEILDAATSLDDLRALRSNRLEALKGDKSASSAFASTRNGAFAFAGSAESEGRRMSKLWTTTEQEQLS